MTDLQNKTSDVSNVPYEASPPTPSLTSTPSSFETDVKNAVKGAVDILVSLQDPAGWWKGELETNVTMDAEDLLLREFLGVRTEEQTAGAAKWIRSQQREDGTWANFYGGPPELSTTIEAYVALRLAGDPPEAEHMVRAQRFIQASGGIENSRVFTRIWLAIFDLWPWSELPVIPAELMFLPHRVPLNIYDFACWARQTVVSLTIVSAHRPTHRLDFDVPELRSGVPAVRERSLTTWAGRFHALDRLGHVYERHPLRSLRRAALHRAENWIVERQEADGSWGGIQPPWVYSLIALRLQGYGLDHPVMQAGLKGLDDFTIEDEKGRRIEACQSPVWDTALAVTALADAGLSREDPVLRAAARFLLGEEITVKGDWSLRRPELTPGGWAFEFENDSYPDIDDAAEVILALGRTAEPTNGADRRGIAWIEGMQCHDGGWAAFDVDNFQTLCRELPFCDFGELIDPPSADVTAHVLEALGPREHSTVAAPQRCGVAATGPRGRRFMVRALGRELRLRHRRRHPRPRRGRRDHEQLGDSTWRGVAGGSPKRRRRLGRGPAVLSRAGVSGPGRLDAVTDGLGPARPVGRGRALGVTGARDSVSGRHAKRRRILGRAVVHRAPASRATSTSTTTCTGWSSRSWHSDAMSVEGIGNG